VTPDIDGYTTPHAPVAQGIERAPPERKVAGSIPARRIPPTPGTPLLVERINAPTLHEPPGYSHVAVASGRLVFTAGAVPLDEEGRVVGADDHVAQTGQTLANLRAALDAGGATPEDVVKTTVYVVADEQDALVRVWEEVRGSEFAAAPSTLLGVAKLGYTGQLVEIEAVAVIA
jgi:enamine deaminase RidA (YjgF/YER057c/UK114 family)